MQMIEIYIKASNTNRTVFVVFLSSYCRYVLYSKMYQAWCEYLSIKKEEKKKLQIAFVYGIGRITANHCTCD